MGQRATATVAGRWFGVWPEPVRNETLPDRRRSGTEVRTGYAPTVQGPTQATICWPRQVEPSTEEGKPREHGISFVTGPVSFVDGAKFFNGESACNCVYS